MRVVRTEWEGQAVLDKPGEIEFALQYRTFYFPVGRGGVWVLKSGWTYVTGQWNGRVPVDPGAWVCAWK
jgi:hypothetical protein